MAISSSTATCSSSLLYYCQTSYTNHKLKTNPTKSCRSTAACNTKCQHPSSSYQVSTPLVLIDARGYECCEHRVCKVRISPRCRGTARTSWPAWRLSGRRRLRSTPDEYNTAPCIEKWRAIVRRTRPERTEGHRGDKIRQPRPPLRSLRQPATRARRGQPLIDPARADFFSAWAPGASTTDAVYRGVNTTERSLRKQLKLVFTRHGLPVRVVLLTDY